MTQFDDETRKLLESLSTPANMLQMLTGEAKEIQGKALPELTNSSVDWSLRSAAFLALYAAGLDKGKSSVERFMDAWKASMRMRLVEESDLARYAVIASHFDREEVFVLRCARCHCLFSSTNKNEEHCIQDRE